MANTYNQIYVHFVISVKNRYPLIPPDWEHRLHHYITSIIDNRKNKTIIINGTRDHVHILVSMHNSESPSQLMMCVKRESTKFLKTNELSSKFSWQEGYGAFSYTKSHVDAVFKYIANQKEHHKKITSLDEMKNILKNLGFVNPYM